MDQLLDQPGANIPEYTVSDISGAVKRTLEGAFGRIRVRGEITELKRYGSGHIYFSLKDEGAKLSGVIWKGTVSRLGLEPENGVEVIATGRISSYGERSSYQLIVERMEYAGAGALLARIEMLRVRLTAEGLFDPERKQALPRLPGIIGVVTSAQGAVLQDIRTTILRRFARRVLVWPVPVQGEGAAGKIAAAIAGFDRLTPGGPVPRPDVLIVARGGGSLEDLMAFNEEIVVRAVAACRIPLISAVGHETDTTLIDFAADRRAPTPTAAAELAVPMRTELLADLAHRHARITGALARAQQHGRLRLDRAVHGLPDLPALLGTARQRLDDRAQRLVMALPNLVAARRSALARAERHMPDPHTLLASRRSRLVLSDAHLKAALRQAVQRRQSLAARVLSRLNDAPLRGGLREATARLQGLAARLESVSHTQVLARGYVLVHGAGGHPVTSAGAVRPSARLRLQFADGEVGVTADAKKGETRQASLF